MLQNIPFVFFLNSELVWYGINFLSHNCSLSSKARNGPQSGPESVEEESYK